MLASTPPYKLREKLTHKGSVWLAAQIQGVLGRSDLKGVLGFDTIQKTPRLTGKVQSKVLDFADLAPVIGLAPPAMPSAKAIARKPLPRAPSSAVTPVSDRLGRKGACQT